MALIINSKYVYTGDAEGNFYSPGTIVVEGGKVIWVGLEDDCPIVADDNNQIMDVGEKVVIPGLINVHAHSTMNGLRGLCDEGDFFSWAKTIAPFTSILSKEDAIWGSYLSVFEMIKSGTTCVCDCTRYHVGVLAQCASAVGMRSFSGCLANSPEYRKNGQPNWPQGLEETLEAMERFAGNDLVRFYLGAHSPYNCTPELLLDVKSRARELGLHFNIHAAETLGEVQLIKERFGTTPVAWLGELGLLDSQTILTHTVWLEDKEIETIAEYECGVAHCPISNAKLASGVSPIKKLLDEGVCVGLGTDSTLSNNSLDLFEEMKFAVLLARIKENNAFFMTAEKAFQLVTSDAAKVLGMGKEIGSIEVGKKADLVFLDLFHPSGYNRKRLLSDVVFSAGPQNVVSVMVDGRIIFHEGRFLLVDQEAIMASIKEYFSRKGSE